MINYTYNRFPLFLQYASDQETRKAWKRVLTSSDTAQFGCTSVVSPPTLGGTGRSSGEGEGSHASPLHPTFAACDSMSGGKITHVAKHNLVPRPSVEGLGMRLCKVLCQGLQLLRDTKFML